MTRLPGVVLAAGASSRMGQSKALLPAEPGGTLLGRVLGTLATAGVAPLVVVARAEIDLPSAWRDPRAASARLVVNPNPNRGQLSSLLCGLDALDDPLTAAVVVTLVDVALVTPESVARLLDAWERSGAVLVRPTFQGRHGHPVIFGAPVLAALRAADIASGAKPVVRAFEPAGLDVPMDDPAVLEDIDTPEDYVRLIGPMPPR
jgi:molybdenum cofactor cytidylyltransferase